MHIACAEQKYLFTISTIINAHEYYSPTSFVVFVTKPIDDWNVIVKHADGETNKSDTR